MRRCQVILHKYLKDMAGWEPCACAGPHTFIHWQGDYPEKIIMDSLSAGLQGIAQFPCVCAGARL